ncbi:hypothetical protein ABZ654_25985 [Streptomyces hygroscopicus]|uniref:hypothetical protein n=1 Tax=Streptomyces hygroscopicus TaxID=1912 RepID=UPI0033ED00C8
MVACDEVAMPAQHRVRTHEQSHTPPGGQRQPVQQRRQERPVACAELDVSLAELAFQDRDLMAGR